MDTLEQNPITLNQILRLILGRERKLGVSFGLGYSPKPVEGSVSRSVLGQKLPQRIGYQQMIFHIGKSADACRPYQRAAAEHQGKAAAAGYEI
jgi:hypothetical protein